MENNIDKEDILVRIHWLYFRKEISEIEKMILYKRIEHKESFKRIANFIGISQEKAKQSYRKLLKKVRYDVRMFFK